MLLDKIFQSFVDKRPVCVMARGILERIFEPSRLNALFENKAKAGYTRKLHFATLMGLMGDVVLGVHPSVNAAFQALSPPERVVSLTAFYNKLDRVEPLVSAALVRDAAEQAAPLIDALDARLPPWLPGFRCLILDGNHLSATEHRLKALRTTWEAPLPGTALVVLDQEQMLASDVFLTEDGHAQERSLLPAVLASVKARDLWLADRNFCTFKFLFGIAERLGYFLIRQHGTIKGKLLGKRRARGQCATGKVFEQKIRLCDAETGAVSVYRRITVVLDQPTRNGDHELHLLSNVPRKDASAAVLADLYRKRWTLETVFQEITATLECEIHPLAYPKAALFAFCLALVAYNAVSVLKAALRAEHGAARVQQDVSGYYLNLEIRGTYEGMMIAIPEEHWHIFRTLSVTEMASVLKELASHLEFARYQKHPRGPKKPAPKKTAYVNGGHISTFKILNGNK
jgi:DDE family transposase